MGRDIMGYLQNIREEESSQPYLGCVGSDNRPLLHLTDDQIVEMNKLSHYKELTAHLKMLQDLTHQVKSIKPHNR